MVYNVLFICTGNSARSVLAEALLNHFGDGHFRAWSAGSQPKGVVHPQAIATLARLGIAAQGLRSKSWDEFALTNAPAFDFIFTVCDNAAGEACPLWPGKPVTAHWGLPDPAAASEADQPAAFVDAAMLLKRRIALFTSLPLDKLDALSLQQQLRDIGKQ